MTTPRIPDDAVVVVRLPAKVWALMLRSLSHAVETSDIESEDGTASISMIDKANLVRPYVSGTTTIPMRVYSKLTEQGGGVRLTDCCYAMSTVDEGVYDDEVNFCDVCSNAVPIGQGDGVERVIAAAIPQPKKGEPLPPGA